MGGKNPTVVMPSADVDEAVDIVAGGCFGVTGEACTATSKAIVHEDVYEEFVEKMVDHVESIEVGPGLGTTTWVRTSASRSSTRPSTTSRSANKRARRSRPAGTASQATVTTTGTSSNRPSSPTSRTICASRRRRSSGPVLAIIPVSGFEDALKQANDVRYGLAAGLVTQDLTEAHEFANRAEAGIVKINEKTTGLELTSRSGVQGLLERDLPGAGRRGPGLLLDQPHGLHELLTDLQSAERCTQPPSVARSSGERDAVGPT